MKNKINNIFFKYKNDLNSFKNNDINNIFIDSEINKIDVIKNTNNIILSPSLYWVKKMKLPISKNREVYPIIKTLFEEILPEGDYSYKSYKINDDNEYILIAFNKKIIEKKLEKLGITKNKIKNIYLSQNELYDFDKPIKINNTFLIKKDNVIINIPENLIEEFIDVNINDINISNKYITLNSNFEVLNIFNKNYILYFNILLLMTLSFNYYIFNKELNDINNKNDIIFEDNDLQPTSFQNDSLLSDLKSINKKEIFKRNILKYMLDTPLKEEEFINKIEIDKKFIIIEIKNYKNKISNETINYLNEINGKITNYKNKIEFKVKIK